MAAASAAASKRGGEVAREYRRLAWREISAVGVKVIVWSWRKYLSVGLN
jgi:hypothetical protein